MNVTITPEAQDQLVDLEPTIHARIHEVLERLQRWPNVSGVVRLKGALVGQYRIRTGSYRVQFFVLEDRILVTKVGHRDGFYDE